MIWCYVKFFDNSIIEIIKFLHKKKYLEKIMRNKEKYNELKKILANEKLKKINFYYYTMLKCS